MCVSGNRIRHLKMVAAVAATGSVTQAADDVHLTQSAVSHQLRDIEERLGTALFLRVGKRMVPTAAGERVLATARRVLDDVAAAEQDVRRLGTNTTGVLRVCAQCNTGYHWLPSLVEAFGRTHPLVDVVVAVECTMRPLESLLEGRLDLAIVTREVRNQHLRVRPLFDDEHAAIVAPDHPFASRAFVQPADFATERLLLYSGSADDSFAMREILRPAGVEPERVSFVMLTEAILEMVKARLGISVMQTWAVEPAIRAGDVRAVPITPRGIRRRWSAATLLAADPAPHVDAFIRLLAARALPARERPLRLPAPSSPAVNASLPFSFPPAASPLPVSKPPRDAFVPPRRSFMRLLRVTLGLLLIAPAVLIGQGPPPPASDSAASGALPVRRVVLYKTGVGYFEHLGKVRNRQNVTIRFTSAQLDDVPEVADDDGPGEGTDHGDQLQLGGPARAAVGRVAPAARHTSDRHAVARGASWGASRGVFGGRRHDRTGAQRRTAAAGACRRVAPRGHALDRHRHW